MTRTELMQAIIQKQDEYIQELSQSFENRNYGKRPEIMYECYRKYVHIISDLKKQLEECKDENPASGQAWICPRCGKVHSWLSMECDCPPNVITASTIESNEVTEIKGENNCNNCKWGICLTKDWPCADCNGSCRSGCTTCADLNSFDLTR